jgi:hypothetical protein
MAEAPPTVAEVVPPEAPSTSEGLVEESKQVLKESSDDSFHTASDSEEQRNEVRAIPISSSPQKDEGSTELPKQD